MKLRFIPLDASYEVRGREPVIILWSISRSDERIAVLVKGFRPYFYALLDEGVDAKEVAGRIKALSKPASPIISVEPVDKRFFGRPVKALRITTIIPEYVRTYREQVARIRGVRDVLEADIRFVMRYLMDKDIKPFSWYEVEAEEQEDKGGMRVDKVYVASNDPVPVEDSYMPRLRILAFDIEVYAPSGTPHPSRDPVIIISVMNEEGEVRQFTASGHDDRDVIKGFVEYVLRHDPDIIVGYNNNKFDWPYLLERASALKIKLDLSRRIGVEPRTSVYGHISVAGRLNVDLYDYAEEMPEIKVKSLENVAEYLGVMKKSERTMIEWYEMPKYWDDPERRPVFLKYARDDVVATYGIAEKILPFAIQLSYVTGLPLDQVGAASVGFRLEWYLMREAYKYGELVPNREERPPLTYRGAIVLEPKKGIHENIAVLDFSSMYPNIMIKYNVGPDTLLRPGEPEPPEGVWVAPEVGHRFRRQPSGFFKKVLEYLLRFRKALKEELRRRRPGTPEYRVLDERQKAVKVLANATYGYMGWTAARWYCRECAEAVTAWGRQTISKALEIARSLGLATIYGDSVSGDADILVRENGEIRVVKIAELFGREPDQRTPGGKEYRFLRGIETITVDGDGKLVWRPIHYVMRHRTDKAMYRVWLADDWYIDVTEDHSLMIYRGGGCGGFSECLVGARPVELDGSARLVCLGSNGGLELKAPLRVEEIEYNGYVYDLEVEETHTFFANKILVHNTDSLFVSYRPEAIEEFIRRVEEELGFDIKVDKVYSRVFFTEAKKRYIGLLKDGRIDIVGFEAIRGDWAEIAKEIQEQVAEIILREGDVDKAVEHVRKVIGELKEGKVPLEKLIIWKTLTKPLSEYAVEAPHVAAARRMREAGYRVEVGDKIGYIVARGKGRLADRAYPYFMVSPEQVDYDYYVERQIIPAALRILGYYGVSEARLRAASKGQKSLFDFLG